MKVNAVLSSSVDSAWQENFDKICNSGLLVFGFNGLGIVCYKKEIQGETEYFQDLARLSKEISSVVISGCDTDTYGIFRHSAVICDNGKLLGVTDMLYQVDESEYAPGGNLRVYDTSCGRIGIVVGEDLFSTDIINTLSICDAELIVCVNNSCMGDIPQTIVKAQAFMNGIDIIYLSKEQFIHADSSGRIKLSTYKDFIQEEVKIRKEFHTLSFRKRCFGKHNKE